MECEKNDCVKNGFREWMEKRKKWKEVRNREREIREKKIEGGKMRDRNNYFMWLKHFIIFYLKKFCFMFISFKTKEKKSSIKVLF